MASNDEYLWLRRKTGEVDSKTYVDTDLEEFITRANGDLNGAAGLIWGEKASGYADLVNMAEAGSSRSNSDLFKHARDQQAYFDGLAGVGIIDTAGSSTTRPIVRA